jgi:hypothetical protein
MAATLVGEGWVRGGEGDKGWQMGASQMRRKHCDTLDITYS